MGNHGYAGANPHVGYAASRISFSLNGRTNKFGWLQASATKVSLLQSLAQTLQPSEFVIFGIRLLERDGASQDRQTGILTQSQVDVLAQLFRFGARAVRGYGSHCRSEERWPFCWQLAIGARVDSTPGEWKILCSAYQPIH